MKSAFYHMAVWNVNEGAGDLIKDILEEVDNQNGTNAVSHKSVAEKIREKAALLRRNERLSHGKSTMGSEIMGFGHYGNSNK